MTTWLGCLEWKGALTFSHKALQQKGIKISFDCWTKQIITHGQNEGNNNLRWKAAIHSKTMPVHQLNFFCLCFACARKNSFWWTVKELVYLYQQDFLIFFRRVCFLLALLKRLLNQGILWAHLGPTSLEKRVSCQTC